MTSKTFSQRYSLTTGTELYGNLWAACHDESVFPDAKTFNADRFIDKDGAFIKSDSKSLMPFSVGECLMTSLSA